MIFDSCGYIHNPTFTTKVKNISDASKNFLGLLLALHSSTLYVDVECNN